jgi:hypothetical protein
MLVCRVVDSLVVVNERSVVFGRVVIGDLVVNRVVVVLGGRRSPATAAEELVACGILFAFLDGGAETQTVASVVTVIVSVSVVMTGLGVLSYID